MLLIRLYAYGLLTVFDLGFSVLVLVELSLLWGSYFISVVWMVLCLGVLFGACYFGCWFIVVICFELQVADIVCDLQVGWLLLLPTL